MLANTCLLKRHTVRIHHGVSIFKKGSRKYQFCILKNRNDIVFNIKANLEEQNKILLICSFLLVDDKRKAKNTAYVLRDIFQEEGLYVKDLLTSYTYFILKGTCDFVISASCIPSTWKSPKMQNTVIHGMHPVGHERLIDQSEH